MSTPTQIQQPWRATARTVFAFVVGLAALMPMLVESSGLSETIPAVAGILFVSGMITRIMATPGIEEFLRRFLPFLAAQPPGTTGPSAADPLDDSEQDAEGEQYHPDV